MDNTTNRIAHAFAKQVKQQYPIKAVYVYGSHVKGTTHEYSDIDIAVIVDPMPSPEFMRIFGGLYAIAARYEGNIEPNLLEDDGQYCKYSFLTEVMETGLRVDVA